MVLRFTDLATAQERSMANGNNGAPKPVRCAIYTRKSTDEGLNQDFNSLDAQRDAGEAYIRSQARKVDCVLVYKVDRLSRSIRDFGRIMEILEKHGATFVSVTQRFNTTTSLGLLALNILLSFAQFETTLRSGLILCRAVASTRCCGARSRMAARCKRPASSTMTTPTGKGT
jgi:site-specific DNA recombinase